MAPPAEEDMLPDFGIWLLKNSGPETEFTFISVPVTQLTRVAQDLFTLTLVVPHFGQKYAVSIDFEREQFIELAAAMPDELSAQLIPDFSVPFRAPAQANLPISIEVSIKTRLGAMQTNDQESYVPLVAKKIQAVG